MASAAQHVLFCCAVLLAWPPSALGFSAVRCTRLVCPKEQRAVRKEGSPKIWAYGCNVTEQHGVYVVHQCCLEKEICMRTCGMPWSKCDKQFEKCALKVCDMDEKCVAVAEAAEIVVAGGDSHMTVCKAYREVQLELCECQPWKEAKEGATARLASFYKSYKPDKLDEWGNVQDVDGIWKKWHGREPELFFELTRKYMDEALDVRPPPDDMRQRWRAEEALARQHALEEVELLRQEQEREAERQQMREEARRRAAEEMAMQQAEEALARRQAAEELARRQAEEQARKARSWEVQRLQAEKDAAVKSEDYMLAKVLKSKLAELALKDEL